MYSGGIDTTYTALQLAEDFNKIHLLTFCNGFCIRLGSSKKHVSLLQEKFGNDKFQHSIILISEILNFLKKDLLKSMLKYRTPLLLDLCCRLSMEIAMIFYCLENDVKYVTEGNNPNTQGEMFLQQERYLEVARHFFSQYDIEYIHPYRFLDTRKEVSRRLECFGIKTGIRVLENMGITSQLFTQPFCLWAPVAFLFTSRLRKAPFIQYFNLSTEDAIKIRLEKEKLAKDIIDYLRLNSYASRLHPYKKNILNKFFRSEC